MQWFTDTMAAVATQVSKFNNANFKNASMAICALVAAADNDIEKEEVTKVAGLIGNCELLSSFNATELRDLFKGYCTKATDEFARLDLLNLVRKLKGTTDQADMAVRIACSIAKADGEFEESEKTVVKEICQILGLNYDEYAS